MLILKGSKERCSLFLRAVGQGSEDGSRNKWQVSHGDNPYFPSGLFLSVVTFLSPVSK